MAFFSLTSFTAGEVSNVPAPVFNAEPPAGGPPVVDSFSPKEITVTEQQTIFLYVKCSSDSPMNIRVLKGKTPIESSSRITIIQSSSNNSIEVTVKISDINKEDAGKYYIIVTNQAGSVISEFNVIVTP